MLNTILKQIIYWTNINHKFNTKLCLRILFHSLGLLHHINVVIITLNLDFSKQKIPELRDLNQHVPRFLTGWNAAFQLVFLMLALCYDIAELGGNERSKTAKRLRYLSDILFTSLVFPCTVFVVAMFWSLYFIDRQLVYPEYYDQMLTWGYNLSLHVWVLLVVTLEMFLQPKSKPRDQKLEVSICWVVQVAYCVVFYGTYMHNGRWLYPIFQFMSAYQMCIFQVFIWLSIHMFYYIQFPITQFVHGSYKNEGRCKINNSLKIEQNVIENKQTRNKQTNGTMTVDKNTETELEEETRKDDIKDKVHEIETNVIENKLTNFEIIDSKPILTRDRNWSEKFIRLRNKFNKTESFHNVSKKEIGTNLFL